jgi:TatD DNase family protein
MQTSDILFTDTHCHLYADDFDADRDQVIEQALRSGVNKILMPNIDLESMPRMNDLQQRYPEICFSMIGLHPTSVKADYHEKLIQIEQELERGRYIAIGETGIDLYWDTSTKEIQIDSFEQHIIWAKTYNLPIVIHSRESLDLNINLIKKHQDGNLRGVFHCFGGTFEQAMSIHELGFKVGIGGVITFKKSELGSLLPAIPKEMIVLETDSPYLAPTPHRGKRNEPSYILLIAQKTAECLSLSLADLALLTNSNATEVFGKKG